MKIAIIGLPQTGKKTLFEILTGHHPTENEVASGKPIKNVAEIRDGRFDFLTGLYRPKKAVRARIDIELLPKLEKEAIREGKIFEDIEDADALCHVVRAFADDSVYHVDGSVDPKRDIDTINSELILRDLLFIEKRLERLDKKIKLTKDEPSIKEKGLLERFKTQLEGELPLRLLKLSSEEQKFISSYPFITFKEMIVVLNVSEAHLKDQSFVKSFADDLDQRLHIKVIQVSAKVEGEIIALESENDRKEFMESVGISEPAIHLLTRACLSALNLLSFFTVGADEVRQWTVKVASTAPEAAGAIHSDLQKGFIRAELIKYLDLKELGSEEAIRAKGKIYLKGKDYIVEDGDILNIRFNV